MTGARKKILVLSSWLPFPPDNGYKIRVFNSIKSLSRRYDVHLLSLARDPADRENIGYLKDFCREVEVSTHIPFEPSTMKSLTGAVSLKPRSIAATYSRDFERLVAEQLAKHHFDLAIAEELSVAAYLQNYAGKKMLSQHNIESDFNKGRYLAATSPLGRSRHYLSWLKSRYHESRLCRDFDLCTVVSDDDRAELTELCGEIRIETIPNGVDLAFYGAPSGEANRDALIYNGSPTYAANADAISWFVAEMLPLIKPAVPDVRLKVTGAYEKQGHAGLAADPAVELTGYLPDIRTALSQAAVCVVPLRVGAGTRIKILEAMAQGVPVVATSLAAKGLTVESGRDIVIADTPDSFAASTVELLCDPDRAREIGSGGRRLVEREYDWAIVGRRLEATVDALVGG